MKILLKKDDVSATDVVVLNLLLQFFPFMCKINLWVVVCMYARGSEKNEYF